jgi:ArsR family transcriptional regulator
MVTREVPSATIAVPCCDIADIHIHTPESENLERAAAVFKALSDETRLRLLRAIARAGELCECYAVPAFGLSQPTINYHLKLLREAGLIQSERRGQWVYHRLDAKAVLGAVRRLTEIT